MFGAQALSTLHFVLVPHHLCAEHGVLEDSHEGEQAHDHSSPESSSPESSSSEATEQSTELDGHDACSVATRTEHGARLEGPALGQPTLVGTDVASASAGVLVKLERAALLSRAPKTSPPGRA